MDNQTPAKPTPSLYTQADITARGRISKSHLYNLMARGQFPQPALRCGPRFTRWAAADVDAWFVGPQAYIDANGTKGQGGVA